MKHRLSGNVQVSATYKTKVGQSKYSLTINPNTDIVLAAGGYRTWRDGMYAASCKEYRTPATTTRAILVMVSTEFSSAQPGQRLL